MAGAGLESFVDWANPIPPTEETQGVNPVPHISGEPIEESEHVMSSLVA